MPIGDRSTGECLLVDPAYAVTDLLDTVTADGMRVTGVLATHYHPDHVGGSMMGLTNRGHRRPARTRRLPDPRATRRGAVGAAHDRRRRRSPRDSTIRATSCGSARSTITLIHTPGHTPGSQCFHVDGRLVSGDTLFLDGCGRTDLPGSNPEDMYDSLQKLAALPTATIVYPGHRYSLPSSATLESIRESNYVFRPQVGRAMAADVRPLTPTSNRASKVRSPG